MLQDKFIHTIHEVSYFLQQFLIILDSCPSTDSVSVPFVKLHENDSPMLYVRKFSSLWNEIHSKAENDLEKLESLQRKLFTGVISTISSSKIYENLITKNQYYVITRESDEFENILQNLRSIKVAFCYREYKQSNALLGGIDRLEQMVENLLDSKKSLEISKTTELLGVDVCEKKVENLQKKILLCVQKIYKKYIMDKENFAKEHDADVNPIKENHLKDELLKSLNDEVDILDIEKVYKRGYGLIRKLLQSRMDYPTRKR